MLCANPAVVGSNCWSGSSFPLRVGHVADKVSVRKCSLLDLSVVAMQTRASLLLRIRDPKDGLAWAEFVRLYTPLIYSYGIKNGLQDADAADVAQETLRSILRAVPNFSYDPDRGSFRGWVFTIARNAIRKSSAHTPPTVGTGDSNVYEMLAAHPAPSIEQDDWDRDYQLNLIHWAADRVKVEFREKTWQAFWRTVVRGEEINTVATELGVTPGSVYIARSRVTARIRHEIQTIEGTAP